MATFSTLVTRVLNLASQDSGGDFQTMAKAEINRVYRRLLNIANVDEQHREFTLTTEADTSKYGMPLYVKEVLNIEDPDNDRRVYDISYREYDIDYPGTTDSGDPVRAYPYGVFGVEKQPASDGTLTLVSSSTADDGTNYKIQVTGFNTSEVLVTETVTMDGTTGVATSNSFDSSLGIERITKVPASGYTFSGNITVTDDDANTLSVIPVWMDSPSYQWYEFHPIPSSAITYTVRALMRKMDLKNDQDWPEIDEDFHDLLVDGPLAILLSHVGKSESAKMHWSRFNERMEEFKGSQGRAPARVRTFSNIQNYASGRDRPHRPLISGVDI